MTTSRRCTWCAAQALTRPSCLPTASGNAHTLLATCRYLPWSAQIQPLNPPFSIMCAGVVVGSLQHAQQQRGVEVYSLNIPSRFESCPELCLVSAALQGCKDSSQRALPCSQAG